MKDVDVLLNWRDYWKTCNNFQRRPISSKLDVSFGVLTEPWSNTVPPAPAVLVQRSLPFSTQAICYSLGILIAPGAPRVGTDSTWAARRALNPDFRLRCISAITTVTRSNYCLCFNIPYLLFHFLFSRWKYVRREEAEKKSYKHFLKGVSVPTRLNFTPDNAAETRKGDDVRRRAASIIDFDPSPVDTLIYLVHQQNPLSKLPLPVWLRMPTLLVLPAITCKFNYPALIYIYNF